MPSEGGNSYLIAGRVFPPAEETQQFRTKTKEFPHRISIICPNSTTGNSRSNSISSKERQSPTSTPPPPASCLSLILTDHHPDNMAPSPSRYDNDVNLKSQFAAGNPEMVKSGRMSVEIRKYFPSSTCVTGRGPTSQRFIIFVYLSQPGYIWYLRTDMFEIESPQSPPRNPVPGAWSFHRCRPSVNKQIKPPTRRRKVIPKIPPPPPRQVNQPGRK